MGKTNDLMLNQALDNFDNRPDKNRLSFDTKDFDINFLRGVSFEDGAATLTELSGTIIGGSLFSMLSKKIKKYSPFIHIDVLKYRKILKEVILGVK